MKLIAGCAGFYRFQPIAMDAEVAYCRLEIDPQSITVRNVAFFHYSLCL